MFYKIATNTELANTEALLLGKVQLGSCEFLVTPSSINQYIILFYVFLCKDTLFNMYCWFINIKLTANSTIIHTWTKLI